MFVQVLYLVFIFVMLGVFFGGHVEEVEETVDLVGHFVSPED